VEKTCSLRVKPGIRTRGRRTRTRTRPNPWNIYRPDR